MSGADFAAYDAPELLDGLSVALPSGEREIMLRIEGMHCGACVQRIETALKGVAGSVRADVPTGSCELRWRPERTPLSALLARIDALGFGVQVLSEDAGYQASRQQRRAALLRIGLALLFGMQVMMLASAEYFGEVAPAYGPLLRYAQWLLATPVALYAGWPLLTQGFRALAQGAVTMDTPVAIAITAAYTLSAVNTLLAQGHVYFDSVVMFVLLLLIARYFQQRGQFQAADRLRRLLSAQPVMAQRLEDGRCREIPVNQLREGDVVLVPPGAGVPADGRLQQAAELDESLLTGEVLPQARAVGEPVLAGSINLGLEPLRLTVGATGTQTVLSQIARLVQRAQLERPAFDTAVERVARHFVMLVLVLAAGALVYWRAQPQLAIQTALAVLVVTCPCALSLAVPTTLAAAITRLARQSVLLVRTDLLLRLGRLTDICLDKTGTLTTRAMRIARVRLSGEADEARCRAIAARLEAGLSHPIARAFSEGHEAAPAAGVALRPGQGVYASFDGHHYAIESLGERQVPDGDPFLRWFALSEDGRELARFGLEEQLRPGVRPMIQGLKAQGLTVHLLSGDTSQAADGVARYIGVGAVHAGQTPESKLGFVRRLQADGRRVMAVGDGINDGPLLAGADAAIGMASGAALAQAHGDAILMASDVRGLSCLFEVGRRARRIIVQNFAWALAYNLTMVPLAFAGWITPWIAALGMGASSLLVTLNALRLLRPTNPYRCAPEGLKEMHA